MHPRSVHWWTDWPYQVTAIDILTPHKVLPHLLLELWLDEPARVDEWRKRNDSGQMRTHGFPFGIARLVSKQMFS